MKLVPTCLARKKIKIASVKQTWTTSVKKKSRPFHAYIMIHSANPKSRPVGIIVFAHVVRPYVRLHFSNLEKQNNRNYWRDCGSGRVDHWWLLPCAYILHYSIKLLSIKPLFAWGNILASSLLYMLPIQTFTTSKKQNSLVLHKAQKLIEYQQKNGDRKPSAIYAEY